MTKTKNSCEATHHSLIQKIAKDNYMTVYMLQLNWNSMMKNWCAGGGICGCSLRSVCCPRFIFLKSEYRC